MKMVFSDISTVAHMWANKQQDSARYSGGNFYYEGNTIYSYGSHFPIARHIEHNNKKAVLLTLMTYSNTTAKHVSVVKQACHHLNVIYCMYPEANRHADNFSAWQSIAETTVSHLKTARKPEKYLNELNYITGQVNRYAEFFEVPIPDALKEVLSICTKEQYTEYQTKQAAQLEAERKRQERKDKVEHKKALAKWEAGETTRLYKRDGYDYLRPVGYGPTAGVETSQGVTIPIAISEKFWERIKDNSLKVGDTITDQYKHKYEVSEVGDVIRIGCHTFKRSCILKFGNKLFVNKLI